MISVGGLIVKYEKSVSERCSAPLGVTGAGGPESSSAGVLITGLRCSGRH